MVDNQDNDNDLDPQSAKKDLGFKAQEDRFLALLPAEERARREKQDEKLLKKRKRKEELTEL